MPTRSQPPRIGPLVGRAAELATVAEILEGGGRLVTLVGVGGAGKTRLAGEIARAHGATAFVALADAHDRGSIARAFALALGAPASAADDDASIAEAIAAAGIDLAVLDDADHAVEALAEALPEWLERAPRWRAIVTSRERLRIAGERVVEIGPLSLEESDGGPSDAARLFLARMPGIAPEPGTPAMRDVETCAALLEGHPLAIEIAATRTHLLSPAELAARLRERGPLDALGAAPRGVPARHASLRRVLDDSWQQLGAAERDALARLSVLRGGGTLATAEHLVGGASAIETIEQLRDRSLLAIRARSSGPDRVELLAPVREHAAERLAESGHAPDAHQRHAEHFVAAAEAGSPAWAATEEANLLAIVRAAAARELPSPRDLEVRALLAIDAFVQERGPFLEHAARLAAALSRGADLDPVLAARARASRGAALGRAGDLDAGLADLDAAADALGALGRELDCARVRVTAAYVCIELGRRDEAVRRCRATLEMPALSTSPGDEARTRRALASALPRHRHAERIAEGERALALARRADVSTESVCLSALATFAANAGDLAAAREHAAGARACAEHVEHVLAALIARAAEPIVAVAAGDTAAAVPGLREYARECFRLGDRTLESTALRLYGIALWESGELAEARAAFDRAVIRGRKSAQSTAARAWLAAASARLGGVDAGASHAAATEEPANPSDDPTSRGIAKLLAAHLHLARARAAFRGGDIDAGARHRRAAEARISIAKEEPVDDAPGALSLAGASFEARAALRTLDAALADARPTLVVDPTGRALRLLDGTIAAPEREPMRRLLSALAAARVDHPGEPVPSERLVALGWPGEKILATAARNRLHVTIALLRKLGLRDAIRSDERGYWIDAGVPVWTSDVSDP